MPRPKRKLGLCSAQVWVLSQLKAICFFKFRLTALIPQWTSSSQKMLHYAYLLPALIVLRLPLATAQVTQLKACPVSCFCS